MSKYKTGDKVWLEAMHLNLPYQTPKLAPQCQGPFNIVNVVSLVAYRLQLPMAWNIHDVFHASLLTPYRETASHGPNFTRPPPNLVQGNKEFEVETIINHWFFGRCKTLQYLIKWKGYPSSDNTWEPVNNVHAPEIIETTTTSLINIFPTPYHPNKNNRNVYTYSYPILPIRRTRTYAQAVLSIPLYCNSTNFVHPKE